MTHFIDRTTLLSYTCQEKVIMIETERTDEHEIIERPQEREQEKPAAETPSPRFITIPTSQRRIPTNPADWSGVGRPKTNPAA